MEVLLGYFNINRSIISNFENTVSSGLKSSDRLIVRYLDVKLFFLDIPEFQVLDG